ncbi:tripartite tricarboxylate transporter substrate binding protein [soil metagenome]
MNLKRQAAAVLLATLGLFASFSARADWPNDKPFTIIVPFAPGGVTDVFARLLSRELQESFGKTFIVMNKPGAGGLLGTTLVAQAAPDGYTILLSQIASQGTLPNLYQKIGYDPVKSFSPIILLSGHPGVLAVNPSLPVKSVQELIDLAKAKPGSLNFASAGTGTTFHLSGELFNLMAGVSMVPIHYQGGAPAVNATLSGEVNLVFSDFQTAMPHVKAGTLRALGVTSSKRSSAAPDLPAISETPGLESFEVLSWMALAYPAGVPDGVAERMNVEVNKILKKPAVVEYLTRSGGTAIGGSRADLSKHVDAELAKWKSTIEKAKIPLQ